MKKLWVKILVGMLVALLLLYPTLADKPSSTGKPHDVNWPKIVPCWKERPDGTIFEKKFNPRAAENIDGKGGWHCGYGYGDEQ